MVRNPWSSLIPLSCGSFNVIVGMDWLSKRKFVIVCHEKVVRIPLKGDEILRFMVKTDQVSSFSSYTRRFQDVKLARIYIDSIIARNGILPPQADGQGERMIQTLEDVMRACFIDFGGSYDWSIRCAPFEALYGRKCRSPVLWAEIRESSLTGLEEYDLWSMRMEQYLTFTDHALWEVIVNGDLVTPVSLASAGAEGPIPPKTAKQKLARKNELKAKSTLMLAIPDEYLLKFHAYKDAKPLWEAIKNSQEGLDKTYDRFQKLISQFEIHGEVISQEDANLKLLRSLPLAWNNIALIMRNKSDLDTLSMDNLYNNLKVYESEIKGQSSLSSNSQNVAFVSFDNSSSTNETINTAYNVSAARSKDQASTALYDDDVMFSFFANQSNAPQLDNKDLE
ncbi:ribonuclease H-like domain-containing protein [Tanacetum coccineum]